MKKIQRKLFPKNIKNFNLFHYGISIKFNHVSSHVREDGYPDIGVLISRESAWEKAEKIAINGGYKKGEFPEYLMPLYPEDQGVWNLSYKTFKKMYDDPDRLDREMRLKNLTDETVETMAHIAQLIKTVYK